jgi:diguanylate cyclase (GGDEF)-like protein
VNDALGYLTGDRVLVAAAALLGDAVREGDLVGRLGGDQFAVLAPDVTAPELAAVVERIGAGLAAGVQADGHPVSARAGVGVAHAAPGDTGLDLLGKADIALRSAKAQGRGRPAYYESAMKVRFLDQAALLEGCTRRFSAGRWNWCTSRSSGSRTAP